MRTIETGALTSTAIHIRAQLAADIVAQRKLAKRKAEEAAARREEAEMVIKREAEEAVMREAEGPMAGSWGKLGGGWRVKPAEQKVKTSDPSVLGWGWLNDGDR